MVAVQRRLAILDPLGIQLRRGSDLGRLYVLAVHRQAESQQRLETPGQILLQPPVPFFIQESVIGLDVAGEMVKALDGDAVCRVRPQVIGTKAPRYR